MFKLPIRTWVCNAAAVFSGRHGAVTQQADEAGCSRETVYEHARKVERRLAQEAEPDTLIAQLRAEIQRLRQAVAEHRRQAEDRVLLDKTTLRRFATIAFATGLGLRQIEELLGVLLPQSKVPDHSTLGTWAQAQARSAEKVLAVLDVACASRVQDLAVDEIFFGGGRPWSPSNRRA
jgi:AcrR family transcriptional regulator